MGKYSLDAFERYPLVKLRPAMQPPEPGRYRLLSQAWPECTLQEGEEDTILLPLLPEDSGSVTQICQWLGQLGSKASGGRGLAGVVMAAGAFSGREAAELARAYARSFRETVLLVEPGTELARVCRREGILAGLWLPLERGILNLRRAIAMEGWAGQWEQRPVYLLSPGELTTEELEAARRWHASGADCLAPLGARMTLRRMMFPRDLTAGGVMPLRMWWQNLGTAPLYAPARVQLELRSGSSRLPIVLEEQMPPPGLGDSTCNALARLPAAAPGVYSLWCGLEAGGKKWKLSMEAPEDEGMYRIGELTLDDIPRPYLQTMWQEQYADGYYPLEDPAQPE